MLAGGDWGFADGKGTAAKFADLHGGSIIVAPDGSLLLTDGFTRVRRVAADGTVTTLAGGSQAGHVDGPRLRARFNGASGLVSLGDGHLLVVDSGEAGQADGRIRRVAPDGSVATLAGGGSTDPRTAPCLKPRSTAPKVSRSRRMATSSSSSPTALVSGGFPAGRSAPFTKGCRKHGSVRVRKLHGRKFDHSPTFHCFSVKRVQMKLLFHHPKTSGTVVTLITLIAGALAIVLADFGAPLWVFIPALPWLATVGLPTTAGVLLVASILGTPACADRFLVLPAVGCRRELDTSSGLWSD